MNKFDISAKLTPLPDQYGKMKAIASVTIDNVAEINDLTVIENEGGFTIGYPQSKDREGRYRNIVEFLKDDNGNFTQVSTDLRTAINDTLLAMYKNGETIMLEKDSYNREPIIHDIKAIVTPLRNSESDTKALASVQVGELFKVNSIRVNENFENDENFVLLPFRSDKSSENGYRNIFNLVNKEYDENFRTAILKQYDGQVAWKPPLKALPPIADNENINDFLNMLKENNIPTMKDFTEILNHVTAIEGQLATAIKELSAMRTQLAEAEAKNHPIKATLQKSVIATKEQATTLRNKLNSLKQNIIESCKNAVSAFKDKGVSALNNVVEFFKIKPALESLQNSLDKGIDKDNKAIAKIEKISKEYHSAGMHLKNIGRAFVGKESIQEAKPVGELAKAFTSPFRAEKKCFESMKNYVSSAINTIDKLEKAALVSLDKNMQATNRKQHSSHSIG